MISLPFPLLRANFPVAGLDRPSQALGCDLAQVQEGVTRRNFLSVVSAAIGAFGGLSGTDVNAQLEFSPNDGPETPQYTQSAALQLGQIPNDFWFRPRELWLRRQGTNQEVRLVYWKDGRLLSEGYWQACAMLKDVSENVMTTMDPTILDVLRGVAGYYEAWQYHQPIVLTSGFRTLRTNSRLLSEGAAKNSMHLYGKAVDLYIPGIPARDIGILGMHLQQGGVGFYPSRGFTHLDTGRLSKWVCRYL